MALWSKKPNAEQEQPKAAPVPEKAPAKAPVVEQAAAKELSPEDMQKRRAASAQLLLRFGEVVSVLMRAPQFRGVPLAELQTLVVPPLMSGQFLVAEAQSKSQGFVTPVAIALWAKVSKEVDQRLSRDLDQPMRLTPNEWSSGEIGWLVVVAGNVQALSSMLKQLQEQKFKGQSVKMRTKDKDGKVLITTL